MFSIVYGFLVSSVINLFGREITQEMKKRPGKMGSSVLGEFKKSITLFILRGVSFLFISILYLLISSKICEMVGLEIFLNIKYFISGYFMSQIAFILISMYHYFVVLFEMLMDETILQRSAKKLNK